MYLLDTNIVSQLDPRRQGSVPALVGWIARNGAHLFLSALTFMELEAGILKLRREGKARTSWRRSAAPSSTISASGSW